MKNIVLKQDNLFIYYYYVNNKIFETKYLNNTWLRPKLIIEDVLDYFTIAIDNSAKVNIFYQDLEGNVNLLINENESWIKKVILYNNNTERFILNFSGYYSEDFFQIFYLIPRKDEKKNLEIITQILDSNQKWHNPITIGSNIKYFNIPFKLFKLKDNKIILYITFNEVENTTEFVYRIFNKNILQEQNKIFATKYNILDTSLVEYKDLIYCICLIKGIFSYQLIFFEMEKGIITNTKIIFEGTKIENILIFYINDILHISYTSNENIFYCFSNSFGKNFSKIIRFHKKISGIQKAEYISNLNVGLTTNEIYCNSKNKIIFINDLFDDFYFRNENVHIKENSEYIGITEKEDNFNDYIKKINTKINFLEEENNLLQSEIKNLRSKFFIE